MNREGIYPTIIDGVAEHGSARAWALLSPNSPSAITPLKEQRKPSHKSGVYRLHGAGPRRESIIAKRCLSKTAPLERELYKNLFPRLPLARLDYHGFVEEPESDFCWLFLGDAGEDRTSDEHRMLKARWLGVLHSSAAAVAAQMPLPDRGACYYAEHFRSARDKICDGLGNRTLAEDDRAVLHDILRQLDLLESYWPRLERLCSAMPQTLVHGDFVSKNVRVRSEGEDEQLVVLDWETAGWGIPAADLAEAATKVQAQPISEAYAATVRNVWRDVTWRDVLQIARVGMIFRLTASIHWASYDLKYEWVHKTIRRFQSYHPKLAEAMAQLDEA